jgi:triosephosphate isomerase
MKLLLVINLKTYKQGRKVLELARIIEKVNKNIIIAAQPTDIFQLAEKTKLKVYSQHVDYFLPGRNTGFILPESIKKDGASGSFLNHSEHRLPLPVIKKTIERCRKLKLKTMVFSRSINEAKKIEKFKPDYIIIEPPELIAGKISVSEAKPELIKKISRTLKIKFLVGAGIHSKKDILIALKLGASGIALSSAITTARNPGKKLKELLS